MYSSATYAGQAYNAENQQQMSAEVIQRYITTGQHMPPLKNTPSCLGSGPSNFMVPLARMRLHPKQADCTVHLCIKYTDIQIWTRLHATL